LHLARHPRRRSQGLSFGRRSPRPPRPPIIEAVAQPRPAIPEAITRCGVIAIGRRLQPDDVVALGRALVRGGVQAFEITMGNPGSLDALGGLSAEFRKGGELLVGAGTVLDEASAEEAIRAGATF